MSDRRSGDYPPRRTGAPGEAAPELAANEARQGVKGHNVRYVLAIGTIGALAAVALAYLFFFA